MNPAKDKRQRLFHAFNKENYHSNLPQSALSSQISIVSYENDTLHRIQAELIASKKQNEGFKRKIQYQEKMQCFYLSQLASLRQKYNRISKRIKILCQQLPSQNFRQNCQYQCQHCSEIQKENHNIRNELQIKNRLINSLQQQIQSQSHQFELKTKHQQSLWLQQKSDHDTRSYWTNIEYEQ